MQPEFCRQNGTDFGNREKKAITTRDCRLGRADVAFQELERGLKERDPWLVYLNVDPFYGNIRGDPSCNRHFSAS